MPVALTNLPPLGNTGKYRVIDGGLALRHYGWLNGCNSYIGFTLDELDPIPESVVCPACRDDAPIVGWFRAELEELVASLKAGVLQQGTSE